MRKIFTGIDFEVCCKGFLQIKKSKLIEIFRNFYQKYLTYYLYLKMNLFIISITRKD